MITLWEDMYTEVCGLCIDRLFVCELGEYSVTCSDVESTLKLPFRWPDKRNELKLFINGSLWIFIICLLDFTPTFAKKRFTLFVLSEKRGVSTYMTCVTEFSHLW